MKKVKVAFAFQLQIKFDQAAVVALIPVHALAKRMSRKKLHQLGENGLALVHARYSFRRRFVPEEVPIGSAQFQVDNNKN
jgi:hypothetical protein